MKVMCGRGPRDIYNLWAFFTNSPWNNGLGGGKSNFSPVLDGISSLVFFFPSPFLDPRRVELVLSELPHRGSGNTDTDLFLYIPGVFAGGQGGCCLLLALCEEQLLLKIARGEWVCSEKHSMGYWSKEDTSTAFKCFWDKSTIQPSSGWTVHVCWNPDSAAGSTTLQQQPGCQYVLTKTLCPDSSGWLTLCLWWPCGPYAFAG